MPRTPRLVLPLLVLLLLAACAAPPRPLEEGRGEGGSATASPTPLPPTATPRPTPTATPTAAPPPTATPLPTPVAPVLRQLESSWGLGAEQVQYAPASEAETAHLAELAGVQAGDLGAVFKVKTAEGSQFWATEREGAFAVRQVAAYERYENGQPVAVPAHEEAVVVKRMLDDPTEFGHWNGGKVVEVETAEGTGWYYPGEKGEWEKIYESGFDYEFLSRLAAHFKEVTGVDYRDWAEGKMGKNTAPARLQMQYVYSEGGSQYWARVKYIGFHLGAGWIHTAEGNFLTEVEAFPMYNHQTRRNETALVPVLVGKEINGQWYSLMGRRVRGDYQPIQFTGENGYIEPTQTNVVSILTNDKNLGKEIMILIAGYINAEQTLQHEGKTVNDKVAQKYGYNSLLSEGVLDLLRQKFPDWASWFGSLPKEDQERLMQAIRQHGMLPVAVFENDPALEEMMQQYPVEKRPVGLLPWEVKVKALHRNPYWGKWILP